MAVLALNQHFPYQEGTRGFIITFHLVNDQLDIRIPSGSLLNSDLAAQMQLGNYRLLILETIGF